MAAGWIFGATETPASDGQSLLAQQEVTMLGLSQLSIGKQIGHGVASALKRVSPAGKDGTFSDQRDPNRVEENSLESGGWGRKKLGSWGGGRERAALVWLLSLC